MPSPEPADRSPTNRWDRTLSLVRMLAIREFRTRYRQSALDAVWSLINPVVVMVVYGVILRAAFHAGSEGVPYLSFAWTGLVVWTFFSSSMAQAMPSLVESADLLTKVYFPREAIPLAMVAATLVDLGIGVGTAVAVAAVQGVYPSITVLGAVAPLAILVVWTGALAVLCAVLTVFIRDVNHAGQLLLRVGFFATPVMYAPSALPSQLRWTAKVNPVSVCIEGIRASVLQHRWPDWGLLTVHGLVGVALFAAALAYTRSVEGRIPDVV